MPTLKLARIVYKENNMNFKSVDAARTCLRTIEGKGNKKPQVVFEMPERVKNPYKIPETSSEERKPLILPKSCDNILLISDLHIPYHNVEAITLAIEYGQKANINTVFINGDLMDFHQLSRFMKDPKKRSVKHEFDTTKAFLVSLREAFPVAEIYWLK
jgi:hypothetical protein